MAIYATAKAAVIALTESIRDDLARDGIGASVLCPGPIKSRIHESALSAVPGAVGPQGPAGPSIAARSPETILREVIEPAVAFLGPDRGDLT